MVRDEMANEDHYYLVDLGRFFPPTARVSRIHGSFLSQVLCFVE